MWSWAFLLVLALVACGNVEGSRPDAVVTIDAPSIDAPVAPSCAGRPFDSSSPVASINTASDDMWFRLSPDELTAVFSIVTNNVAQPFMATRPSITAQFSTPTALAITGNNNQDVSSPSLTADGLTLYFTSMRTGTAGTGDIWKATRAATSAQFGNIVAVAELESTADENDVYIIPDESAIYFSSARNSAVYSIFRAMRQGARFTPPIEVLQDRPLFVSRVVVTADERMLFYQVGNDLHETDRATTAQPFMPGTYLRQISSPAADQPTWISADGCRLYFMTNRVGGIGGFDIHVAVRTPQ